MLRLPQSGNTPVSLINKTTGRMLAHNLLLARDMGSQFIGLMGATDFSQDAALGLSRCNWVHTFLVRFPLDVVYCSEEGTVLTIIAGIKPNRFGPRAVGAYWTYEMRSGHLAPYVSPGDQLTASSLSTYLPGTTLAKISSGEA